MAFLVEQLVDKLGPETAILDHKGRSWRDKVSVEGLGLVARDGHARFLDEVRVHLFAKSWESFGRKLAVRSKKVARGKGVLEVSLAS